MIDLSIAPLVGTINTITNAMQMKQVYRNLRTEMQNGKPKDLEPDPTEVDFNC